MRPTHATRLGGSLPWLATAMAVAAFAAGSSAPAIAEAPRLLPVPAVTIYPGDVLGERILIEKPYPAGQAWLAHMVPSRDRAVGRIAKRTLPAGYPIPSDALRGSYLVQRGQAVTLVYRAGALTITASGLALASAGQGERLSVRSSDSGRIVEGAVEEAGTVVVESR